MTAQPAPLEPLAFRHLAPARPPVDGDGHRTVVLLHGRGADEDDLLGLVADLPRDLLYVSVRAPRPFPYGGYAWFDHDGAGLPEPLSFGAALGSLEVFLRRPPPTLRADRRRLAVVGFSQGGAVAAALLARGSVRLGAVLSGFLPDFAAPPGAPAVGAPPGAAFVAHGDEDPVVPVAAGRAVRDRLTAAGVDILYREYAMGHSICEEESADLGAWLEGRLRPDRDGAAPPPPGA